MSNVAKRMSKGALAAFLALLAAFAVCAAAASAYADEGSSATVKVGSVSASPGDTVQVAVTIENNPGVLGATFQVAYDEGLTLTGATSGSAFSALSMTKPGSYASPCRFMWDGLELSESDIRDGEVLRLTFTVSENAEPGTDLGVTVSGEDGDVFGSDLNAIEVAYAAGEVSILDYIPGDLDGDQVVNSRDVIYARRHITGGYEQSINVPAADVNNDLKVNSLDVILMRRYITGGYDVVLVHSDLKEGFDSGSGSGSEPAHTHSLEAVAAKSPTCTEAGNIAYWHCASCDKYFSDAGASTAIELSETTVEAVGHTPVIDPAIAPTQTTTGLTEGSHCSVCGTVLKEQQVVPMLDVDEYFITYDVANGDPYLAGLNIANPNKTSYFEGDSFKLSDLSVEGYRFLGWYDGAGDDSTKVMRIASDCAEDMKLYAHWQVLNNNRVDFESDLLLDTYSESYTVDKGLVLPTPKLSNYVFAGWADDHGKIYGKRIPAGTTGNITLHAVWTSERNKTYTKPNPSDPIVYEDEDSDIMLFTYEIGRIENVPLYTIKDFGYINGDGVTKSEKATYSAQTSQSTAETISNVVSHATTDSSSWTLSSGWNETTSISDEWCEQHGYSKTEAETIAKSDSNNWNVSSGSYGSTSSTTSSTDTDGWSNDVKTSSSDTGSSTIGGKVGAELHADMKSSVNVGVGSAEMGIGGSISAEASASGTNSNTTGFESTSNDYGSHVGVSASSSTSGWNSSSSRGGSSTTSRSNTVSTAVSELISNKHGYGKTYINTGGETTSQALANTQTDTDSYSSAVTYNSATSESVESSWTTSATKAGYHRWVVAGTAHVFGVVGYDIKTKSFFVYTYSVMDDETHEFEDYSNTTAAYNDNENGVIGFEVPYDEVMSTVSERVFASDGLKVDLETGTIVDYSGTDTCVIIPEYYNTGDGDVVKITGFSANAFAGNEDIRTVVLSDYITEIPDGAFAGCSSLAFVDGKGVTSIGDSAFANCPEMEECGVFSKVTHLGTNTFTGANRLYVNAANKDVAAASLASGAKGVVLNLRFLEDNEDVMNGVVLEAPETMEYFELNGESHKVNGESQTRTFYGLKVDSRAGETVLNKINVTGTTSLPVKIASPKVTLNQASISSPGIALALTADSASVGLRNTNTVASSTANAMICKNVRFYETASNAVGKLVVPQKLLVCGAIDGSRYLQCDSIETIDENTFNKLLNSYLVHFDAGAGSCDESTREIVYGAAIGELPVPTRSHCTFDGWYLEDIDTKVTAEYVPEIGSDITLVAHWTVQWATDIPDGVYSIIASSNSQYCIDMPNGSTKPGCDVALHTVNNTIAQRFRFKQVDDGAYTIEFVQSGLLLEAYGANANGVPRVCQMKDNGQDTQKWYIEQTADGWHSLRNKGKDFYLDIDGNVMSNGATIQCIVGNGTKAQKFTLKKERYALYNEPLNGWEEAKAFCEAAGGHLATITSSKEQSEVSNLVRNFQGYSGAIKWYWLGGYRDNGSWKWVTNEPFSYKSWDSGQPDNTGGKEDKIEMTAWNGLWNDTEAGWNSSRDDGNQQSEYGLVCEWEDVSTAASTTSSLAVADSISIGG